VGVGEFELGFAGKVFVKRILMRFTLRLLQGTASTFF
jgi:hypothetical protein